ncbi:hypothetical protein FF1_036307 [Malus domestica]
MRLAGRQSHRGCTIGGRERGWFRKLYLGNLDSSSRVPPSVEPPPPPGATAASKVCVLNFTSTASPYNLGAWFRSGDSGGPAIEVRSATLDTWLPEQVAYIQCKYQCCFTGFFPFW